MSTRRDLLLSIAATALPAAAQHEHTEAVADYKLRVFTPEEREHVATLVDSIIPRTKTPGAADAKVPEFIDRKLSLDASLRDHFLAGLRSFDGVLTDENPFCKLLKGLTVDGYYTSKEGLTQELGWHGNTFLTDFEGCAHPEHQAH